jgi:signal transduction histidine kinase
MTDELFDVFAGVGHDLRNPLTSIVADAEHLARTAEDDRTAVAASHLVASAERMARMIDRLVDVSRVGGDVAIARTDFGALWWRVVRDSRALHPDVPISIETAGDTTGDWDEAQLARAAADLVADAIAQGTPGAPIAVHVDGRAPRSVVATVRSRGAALGLGLFVARQVVGAHGGMIAVASSDADGTIVRVALPR